MLIRFWGTRGSLPAPLSTAGLRRKLVRALLEAAGPARLRGSGRRFVQTSSTSRPPTRSAATRPASRSTAATRSTCCATSGRAPGNSDSPRWPGRRGAGQVFHVFLSHLHWDHIQGFPFFVPAYIPGNRILIHGCHEELEAAFRRQHGAPSFPVDFAQLGSTIEFVRLVPGETYEIAGLRVTAKRQFHSGDSYAYRFERDGKVVVYSTDSEHKLDDPAIARAFADFFRDADLVIFDAMYSLADAFSIKEDWGHSSNIVGVELCQMAGRPAPVSLPSRAGARRREADGHLAGERSASRS